VPLPRDISPIRFSSIILNPPPGRSSQQDTVISSPPKVPRRGSPKKCAPPKFGCLSSR
jgi:hypothetical protein